MAYQINRGLRLRRRPRRQPDGSFGFQRGTLCLPYRWFGTHKRILQTHSVCPFVNQRLYIATGRWLLKTLGIKSV